MPDFIAHHPVIIVGGGPGGLATALHIAQRAPALADDLLVLEAAHHPRPKICGGGVTFHGEEQLQALGLAIDGPAFRIHRIVFRLAGGQFAVDYDHAMRIFDRAIFDGALAEAVTARGLNLRSGEKLLNLTTTPDGVHLETTHGHYSADVVIAADGANSTVRRKLGLRTSVGVARLLRVMTPVDPASSDIWQTNTAVFDFSCVRQGIQGYSWEFPVYIDGQPTINRGIFDSRLLPDEADAPHGNLKRVFFDALRGQHLEPESAPLEGHPVRWFNATADFARPRVLLVGDAAGVDPLFAEGISYAMEYGAIAADAVVAAFDQGDLTFNDYRARLLTHPLGQMLQRRGIIARMLFRHRYPALWSLLWRAASVSPRWAKHGVGAALAVLPPADDPPTSGRYV